MKQDGNEMSDHRLDELLKASPDEEPSAALMRAVAEIPIRHPRGAGEAWWPFGGLRRWIVVATAALAAGVALGVALPDDDTSYDALSTVALGADLAEELAP